MSLTAHSTQPTYSFNVETIGKMHTITYKRAKYGIGLLFTLLFVCLFFALPAASISGTFAAIVYFGGSFGVYFALNLSRKDGQFQIDDKQIIVDGRSYNLEHVNQIYMDVKASNREEVISYRPSAGMALRNSINRSLMNHKEKNNWFIGFRYGEKNIKLAGGMKEDTADVLYKKVLALTKGFTKY